MKPMTKMQVRMLLLGLLALIAAGCSSSRGAVGVGWGDKAPEPPPHEIKAAHKHGPPPHAPAHGYRAKHCYRYYPDVNVYYDTGRQIYFYIQGEIWKSGTKLPNHLRIRLGEYHTLEMTSDTPYAENKAHKNKHKIPPGQLKKQGKWAKHH